MTDESWRRAWSKTAVQELVHTLNIKSERQVREIFWMVGAKRSGQVYSALKDMLLDVKNYDAIYRERVAPDPDATVLFNDMVTKLAVAYFYSSVP